MFLRDDCLRHLNSVTHRIIFPSYEWIYLNIYFKKEKDRKRKAGKLFMPLSSRCNTLIDSNAKGNHSAILSYNQLNARCFLRLFTF